MHTQGKSAEALEILDEASKLGLRTLGESHEGYASILESKARCLTELERFGEATALLEQALTIRDEVFGRGSFSNRTTMNELAVAYEKSGNAAAALRILKELADLLTTVENHDTVAAATVQFNLGACLLRQGRKREALAVYEKHLGALRGSNEKPSRAYVKGLHKTAELLQDAGRMEESLKLHEECIVAWEQVMGADHR